MSDYDRGRSEHDQRLETFAAAFDQSMDPLKEFTDTYRAVDDDPFDLFIENVPRSNGVTEGTLRGYQTTYEQYKTFMGTVGRHPACPNAEHIDYFIIWLQDKKGNSITTINAKLTRLNAVYKWLQNSAAFPNPVDYNPIQLAWDRMDKNTRRIKEEHRIPVSELRKVVNDIQNIRDRILVVLGLKLGLRVGEITNIRFEDINIQHEEVRRYYEKTGSDRRVVDHENAIVIPSEREGNKSLKTRILPLDSEVLRALSDWLLIRPDCRKPWVFIGKSQYKKINSKDINRVWQEAFAAYPETDDHKRVTSHYGRHRFTTYWRIEERLDRELIKYMRGDKRKPSISESGDGKFDAIDEYIHTYYQDIEHVYRDRIFNLNTAS